MCRDVYRARRETSERTKRCATTRPRQQLVPGRCSAACSVQEPCMRSTYACVSSCVREPRARALHARARDAAVTRTPQKHAVRCDMCTLEELHASRLWVTKYGRGERGNGSKEDNNFAAARRERETGRETSGEERRRGSERVKDRVKGRKGREKAR